MDNKKRPASTTRELTAYFLLAYALSWSIGIPLALEKHGLIPEVLPFWTHYLMAYGPMLAAMLVTGSSLGRPGLRDLLGRMFRWRVCPKWWIVAFSPLLLGIVLIPLLNFLTGSALHLAVLGVVNYLPPLGIAALLLWFFTFGLGEETGWRGFALPRLEQGRSALSATLILTVFWALWHLPQFFYTYDPTFLIGWAVTLFAGSVLLTWLYNSASNSILMAAIWHTSFNFVTASPADTGLLPMVISMIIILFAVVVVARYKPQSLTAI